MRDPVRAYVLTSGVVFALLTLAHLWRMLAESAALARDPGYLLITAGAAALAVWAFQTAFRSVRRAAPPTA